MLKFFDGVMDFLFRVSRMKDKAKRIKEDEEKREKSIYFGILSILYTIISSAVCVAGVWIFSSFMNTGLVLFTIIIGIAFMLGGLVLFIWALVSCILQLTINKKWISWLSLLVFIAGLVVSILLVLMQMGKAMS